MKPAARPRPACPPLMLHTLNRQDVEAVDDELARAKMHGATFASLHEAWAVIVEEVDELWDETRKKRRDRSREELRGELIQLAAMAHKALASLENFVGEV